MSFRTRLISFFVLIVVVPMAAIGVLVFRLIDDSQTGKADARAGGIAATALGTYENASRQASFDARTVARDLARTPTSRLRSRAGALASEVAAREPDRRLQRVVDIGNRTAIAPGVAMIRAALSRPPQIVAVSELTAAQYARALAGPGVGVVVRSGGAVLGSTLPAVARLSLGTSTGTVTVGSARYRVVTQTFRGFGHTPVEVSLFSDLSTTGSVASDRQGKNRTVRAEPETANVFGGE